MVLLLDAKESEPEKPALFTFTVRISVGRKRSDVVVCDEGIAPAMSEEQNATDDPFAVDRKLTAKVNKAPSCDCDSKASPILPKRHL